MKSHMLFGILLETAPTSAIVLWESAFKFLCADEINYAGDILLWLIENRQATIC